MVKFHPQLGPQVKFAVPLPLGFRDVIVKVWPGEVESAHPVLCPTSVPVPDPVALSVPVNSIALEPHPVFPVRAICHGPTKSALTIAPVALLSFGSESIVTRPTLATIASRVQ
jgi:hypothetical protein